MGRWILLAVCVAAAVFGLGSVRAEDFKGKDLPKRDFSGRNLDKADFSDAKLFLANFKEAKLNGALFNDADLTSASLDGAEAVGADFRDAILENASLQRADLSKADLRGQDFRKTSLQGATLRGADLRKLKGLGDVTRADFRDADLRGAVLLGAVDYGGTTARFRGAKYDKDTRWPKGFDVEGSGAVMAAAEAEPNAQATTPPPAPLERPADAGLPADPTKPTVAGGDEEKAQGPAGAPSEKEVKRLLETTFWAPAAQGGVVHAYHYKTFKFGKSRKGEYRTDGVPANSDTTVYPVLAVVEIVRTFPDGTSKSETKDQAFVFFQDEFDRWTYRFKGNN